MTAAGMLGQGTEDNVNGSSSMTESVGAAARYSQVERVLIYRLGSLGDFVVSLPCLHLVERTFPNATRMLLTNRPLHSKAAPARAVLGDSGIVHQYLDYPVGTRNIVDVAKLWARIRRFEPQVLVHLTERTGTLKRDLRFFRSCGIREVVGVPSGDLTMHYYNPDSDTYEREAQRLARCLEKLGDAHLDDPASWDLRLTLSEKNKAAGVLSSLPKGRLLCCGIGTKQQAKDWEIPNWRAFLSRLAKHFPDYGLVLIGSQEEREASDIASAAWPGRRTNLCGQLTPRESAAVILRTEMFVGPDSGPMHLAAAVGVPSASVFSAQSKPGVWFPFGRANLAVYHKTDCFGCGLEVCVENGKKCILSVTPDEMLEAALTAWRLGHASKAGVVTNTSICRSIRPVAPGLEQPSELLD
jgi:heptosyltransferase-3